LNGRATVNNNIAGLYCFEAMKKLSPSAYRALFFKHVFGFLGKVTSHRELAGSHVIAVSGGVDSMALLWFADGLHKHGKIGPIRAVFVHHHTRVGQDYDGELVKDFCQKNNIPFKILHAQGLDTETGNFENRARKMRRSLLSRDLRPGETLWLGHHLDDSYEWSIMQKYRSGQAKSSLGIPVRNGPIVRPFLCVSKQQLKNLARFEKIIYREDPTNSDVTYDRNFLREELIPLVKSRYSKYLKHYVNHSNYFAVILHLNITNRVNANQIHVYEQGAIIQGTQFSQDQVQELLHSYSNTERGEISSQITKMFKAIDNGKKGPFHFSGGTEIYSTYNLLMIYQQGLKNHDQVIAKVLAGISDEELMNLPTFSWKDLERAWENLTKTSDAMLNMPGLVLICETSNTAKTLNASVYDSLFPSVSRVCKDRDYQFITGPKCLDVWKRKKSKLPERLRLLPLWTLSNLFPFQE
jgi:tRNA(Ile)-lysidine synthase